MESILFDQRMRGAAMNIYCKPPSKLQVNTEVCLCLKLLYVDIWLLLISSANCFAMHFAFCMVTYWLRIKFQRNVQANQINFGNVNTWSRQNI